jgi:AraC-like DNA-binding protein
MTAPLPPPAPTVSQQQQLAALARSFAATPGIASTPWPGLHCLHTDRPTEIQKQVYTPALCVVAQGSKEARLGQRVYRYDALHYLVIGAALPIRARVLEATPARPYLAVVLDLGTTALHDVLADMAGHVPPSPRWEAVPPLRVSPMDGRLLDAVVRFLAAVADPVDRKVLAPGVFRELIYLTLRRDQGALLRFAAGRDRQAPGVARALRHVREHLAERIDVGTLARVAGMSASSLHDAFKRTTTLSPIQYVKRLRLDRARRLLLDGADAAVAAHDVGYESPSHFSRDFRRAFGQPPRRYAQDQAAGSTS